MASEIKSEIKKSKRGGARPGAGRKPKASFDASKPSPARGVIVFNTVDPKRELTQGVRTEIMRRARYLYNNEATATYIIEHLAQRAVGTGIVPQARTADPVWNRAVERAFEDRACGEAWAFDAAAAVNFYGAQSLILRQVACDGDFFAQFLTTADGAARVRFIGAEAVGNTADSGDGWFDGVKVDRFGAPQEYRVITDRAAGKSVDVPSADMLHFRHIRRAGYVRGVSWLHSAAINLQDLAEINAYTKGAFKAASQLGFLVTSPENVRLGGGLSTLNDGSSSASAPELNAEALYNGTLIPKLKPGEDIKMLRNEHPGTSYEPIMRYMVSQIARAIGLPPEAMMLAVGAAGTEFRGLLEVAQNFLERLQQMLIDQFCRRFWKYWVWHEITAGRLPYPGDDWWRHDWVTPRKITVDNGRDGRLYAELMEKGHMSWERYCNIHGLDAESEEDDIITAYQRRAKKCEAAGLDVSAVFPSQKTLTAGNP
ncbi:MAG: phage portal protein [Burkholderiaceae bacterium]|nr:phage portal protein [Burkholderiaceae bacterium]